MTNPILAFSGRRRMRSLRTPILLTVYSVLLAGIAYLTVYSAFLQPTVTLGNMRASVYGYLLMVCLQFGLLVLIAPAMTACSVSGERERQTLDLLLVTNTGAVRLVLGKLLESFGFLALMVLCSMPTLSLVLLTGGATIGQVLTAVLFLMLISLGALSVGLFCSTLLKRTVTATVVSYLAVFGIGLLTLLPIWHDVKRIGDIYDSVNIAGQALPPVLEYTPISFTMNPGLGLFSLLQEQTGMFSGGFMYGISYTLANTMGQGLLPFKHYLACNMIFIAGASALLVALSAVNVRLGKSGRLKGRKKA